MAIRNLEYFFRPRRIAVIGANEEQNSLGYCIFKNLVGQGFKGSVYPINPSKEAVQGVEAYPSITAVTRDIDLAILATSPDEIPAALEQCGQKGVKGVIILCPDFRERAKNPLLLETIIRNAPSKYGFRVLGPDSLGFIRTGINLNASLFPKMPPKGNIAFISQSAALATALLDRAVGKNVGLSCFVSVGARFDIGFSDIIDFLGMDPETRAIILYIESIKRGRKFMTSVRTFARTKPIMVIKSGKFEVSALVALTHSGFLAVEDKVYDAAFKRAGAIRVDEMIDLFYLAESLAKQRRPKGKRLAIISNAGGPVIMAVDALLKLEGDLATLSQETVTDLRNLLPSLKRIQNPIDLHFDASSKEYEIAVRNCLKDLEVDAVLVIYTPSFSTNPEDIAKVVVSAAKHHPDKPLFTSWMGDESVMPARELLNDGGIPTFVTPEQAVKSFIYMYRYDYNLELLFETPESILRDFEPDTKRAEEVIKKASDEKKLILTFDEAKEILLAYGIPVIATSKVNSEEEAVQTSEVIDYPVVLKIDSEKIFHKMEKGGVILNIRDQASVVEAFRRLKEIANSCGDPDAHVLVQPMIVKHGFELVIGAKKDLTFGSVIVFGTGGELLEAVEDYSIGLPPLNQTLARRMMMETKIYNYLKTLGPFNQTLRTLEEILVRFSQLIIDFPQIKEIDINPFFVTEKEGFALDIGVLLEAEVLEGFKSYREEYCPPHLSICPYPVRYINEFQLANGTTVLMRPIRPEDEPLLDELFKTSSEQTMVMRFLQIPKMTHEQLVRYCHVDYDREMAFVAVVNENGRERIVGDVRFSRQPDLENAEMAVVVADRWQGQGIGKRLCDYCIEVAKASGIKRLWMEISINNPRMINLSERLDFKRAYTDNEVIRVVREL